jgi:hypothetical protein
MNAFDLLSESVKYLSHITVRHAEKYRQGLGLFLDPRRDIRGSPGSDANIG